jgi:hypothetical protein
MTRILPGDKKHPPRPDVPILRHLTYREAHLFEVGIWPGVAVALALLANQLGAAIATVGAIRRRMQDKSQEESHQDALTGYVRDGWYLAIGAVSGAVGATGLWLTGQVVSGGLPGLL